MNEGYAWAWYDGEDVYVNNANSLESIIDSVTEYYFWERVKDLKIAVDASQISVTYIEDDEEGTYRNFSCGISEYEVKELLQKLALTQDRVDIFDIKPHSH